MQIEGTTSERSTACRGGNLGLNLNQQKMLKVLVCFSNSSLYLAIFVLEPLLMYFLYCSVV